MSPASGRPTLPRARPRFTIAATLSEPCSCWVMPIDHTSTADSRPRVHAGEALHVGARRAGQALEVVERLALELARAARRSPRCARATNSRSIPPFGEQHLEHAVEERDVAAGVDREELVGHLRAEHRALDVARHPVALEARLAQRVDHGDLGAALAREEQVLHEHGLRVGDVRAEQHDEVGADHVGVRARGRAGADRALERAGRRRVAHPRGVVDVVGAEEARRLLRDVVHLVGDAARGEVEGEPIAASSPGSARRAGRAPRPS